MACPLLFWTRKDCQMALGVVAAAVVAPWSIWLPEPLTRGLVHGTYLTRVSATAVGRLGTDASEASEDSDGGGLCVVAAAVVAPWPIWLPGPLTRGLVHDTYLTRVSATAIGRLGTDASEASEDGGG